MIPVKRIVTVGEPMAMFVADEIGPLDEMDHYTKFVAGAELNVAFGLARLGNQVSYVTRLGADPFGKYIHRLLREAGLDESCVTFDSTYPTGFQLKSKVATGDPEVVYFRKNSAASHLSRADIERLDMSNVAHVHVTGIPLALSPEAQDATFALIERAKQASVRVTFDPNLRPSLWPEPKTMVDTINRAAALCDIVLPGLAEGLTLTGYSDAKDIVRFYKELGVSGVIVKLGPEGAYVDANGEQFVVPGFHVDNVVDTVGAGDGFAVGIISGLLDGLTLRDAVIRGNAIGAMQVMVPGDNEGLPTQAKLSAFLANRQNELSV